MLIAAGGQMTQTVSRRELSYRVVGFRSPRRKPKTVRAGRFDHALEVANQMARGGAKVIIDRWVPHSQQWRSLRFVGHKKNASWAAEETARLKAHQGETRHAGHVLAEVRKATLLSEAQVRAKLRKKEQAKRAKQREADRRTSELIRRATSETPIDPIREEAIRAAGAKATGPPEDGRRRVRGYAGAPKFRRP
ncbi:hypothetical protein ACIRD6_35580 [Streptomyces sp. NPDC102473]|uniref:hypothetical protein n=1 Tax=Streptomyces sp. NPDC102473 TaxID=3366180 RepID=UPI003801B6A3